MKKIVLITLLGLMVAGCQCNNQHSNRTPEVASKQSIVSIADLNAKYMIIAGAYRELRYAERKVKDLEQKGYPAYIINFKEGILAVVICLSDDLDATTKKLAELRGTDVCPLDAWILTNE